MPTAAEKLVLAIAYYRLSSEEANKGESTSIASQKTMVRAYCEQHGIALIAEFVDDGYSGANFNRPDFKNMIDFIENPDVDVHLVLTKDLSRLGRDMCESSYYAEDYFPSKGLRYITTHEDFDNESNNPMTPFRFAMNEAYLRDGSRKVKDALTEKRRAKQYCACPPYGYKRDPIDRTKIAADENTFHIVQRIFERAANGDSTRKIALSLNEDGVIPPLKYRVLYRDNFNERGAARASDEWNYTTVKRILKNEVYLGHTLLGKTQKVSIKSDKKKAIPRENWSVFLNTHPAITTDEIFRKAQVNLGKGSTDFKKYDHVRKSIFSGIAKCGLCGYSMCTVGSVYKGEREKYWYLGCTHNRQDIGNPCVGTRIRYADLLELVRQDLNRFIAMTPRERKDLTEEILDENKNDLQIKSNSIQIEKAQARMQTIGRILSKLYTDNADGIISDEHLSQMTKEFKNEANTLKITIDSLSKKVADTAEVEDNYNSFFNLVKQHSFIETLDRDTLITFVERIEIGEKELPDGYQKLTHLDIPFKQHIKIYYRFIGTLEAEKEKQYVLPLAVSQ